MSVRLCRQRGSARVLPTEARNTCASRCSWIQKAIAPFIGSFPGEAALGVNIAERGRTSTCRKVGFTGIQEHTNIHPARLKQRLPPYVEARCRSGLARRLRSTAVRPRPRPWLSGRCRSSSPAPCRAQKERSQADEENHSATCTLCIEFLERGRRSSLRFPGII